MIGHTRQSPGIEINEIDRSQYDKTDYSIVGTTTLACGFADCGNDCQTTWINSKQNFLDTFGYPKNELETFFYNAANETLSRGGVFLGTRLPYDNGAKDHYSYSVYSVSDLKYIFTPSITREYMNIADMEFDTKQLWNKYFGETISIANVNRLSACIKTLSEEAEVGSRDFYVLNDMCIQLCAIIMSVPSTGFAALRLMDTDITSYLQIDPEPSDSGKMTVSQFDNCITGQKSFLGNDKICFVDITKSNYRSASGNCVATYSDDGYGVTSAWTNDFMGIVPVVTTPANALFFQNRYDAVFVSADMSAYDPLASLRPVEYEAIKVKPGEGVQVFGDQIDNMYALQLSSAREFAVSGDITESVSKQAVEYFPLINCDGYNHIDKQMLRQIGVVVFLAGTDSDTGKVSLTPVESFVGSLDRTAKGSSGQTIFIDDIVNSKSKYINVFSTVRPELIKQASTVAVSRQQATSLGFYNIDRKKVVSYKNSIIDPLNVIFERNQDPNQVPIDLVVDAGITNVAYYVKNIAGTTEGVDFTYKTRLQDFDAITLNEETQRPWYAVAEKYNNFCKYTRRDCIFLLDSPRQLCIDGNQKSVRNTAPDTSIQKTIMPRLKRLSRINSSYTAAYSDWFYIADTYSGDFFWCPPSIKASGIMTYCDAYFHPWNAPAGLERGMVRDAADVAFSPRNDEAGTVYANAWNYAISYPLNGVVMEGQKTMQVERTALDRINVRRLMIHLEKSTVRLARQFLYEGNTEYLRQRFVDTLKPIFEDALAGDGISDYRIRCDDTLNDANTIDNNELKCIIAVKPVKCIEWIVVNFIVTNQSADLDEEIVK